MELSVVIQNQNFLRLMAYFTIFPGGANDSARGGIAPIAPPWLQACACAGCLPSSGDPDELEYLDTASHWAKC